MSWLGQSFDDDDDKMSWMCNTNIYLFFFVLNRYIFMAQTLPVVCVQLPVVCVDQNGNKLTIPSVQTMTLAH